jgi:geranylgeranyl pyrophosphate synthase
MSIDIYLNSYPEWALAAFQRYTAPALDKLKDSSTIQQRWLQSCGPGTSIATRYRLFPGSLYILWLEILGCKEIERFSCVAAALECLHNASLHHDDILDGNDSRRSEETFFALDGASASLLAGDGLIGAAFCLIGSINHPTAASILSMLGNAWYRMTLGQLKDEPAAWQSVEDNFQQEHWLSMTYAKLSIGNIAAPLAAISLSRPELVEPLTILHERFSIASQIMNDIGDLAGWAGFHVITSCNREYGQESKKKLTIATIWQDKLKIGSNNLSALYEHAYREIHRITAEALTELSKIPKQSRMSDLLHDFFTRPRNEFALVLKETPKC